MTGGVLCFMFCASYPVRLSQFSLATHWVLPSLKMCFDPVIQPEQSSGRNDNGMSDCYYQTVIIRLLLSDCYYLTGGKFPAPSRHRGGEQQTGRGDEQKDRHTRCGFIWR
jgi:hypothetical protein